MDGHTEIFPFVVQDMVPLGEREGERARAREESRNAYKSSGVKCRGEKKYEAKSKTRLFHYFLFQKERKKKCDLNEPFI